MREDGRWKMDNGGVHTESTNEARAEPSVLELCLARRRKTKSNHWKHRNILNTNDSTITITKTKSHTESTDNTERIRTRMTRIERITYGWLSPSGRRAKPSGFRILGLTESTENTEIFRTRILRILRIMTQEEKGSRFMVQSSRVRVKEE